MDMNCATYQAKGPIILTNANAARSTKVDKVTERLTVQPPVRDVMLAAIPSLRAFAISLSGSVNSADDLVQETVMRAMTHIGSFTPGTNMSAWLLTILRNLFRSQYRKRRREVEDPDGSYLASLKLPAEQFGRLEFKELIEALAKLPYVQREALLLVAASGFSYDEAAAICEVAVGTIKSRVSRARQLLAELLDIDSPATFALDRATAQWEAADRKEIAPPADANQYAHKQKRPRFQPGRRPPCLQVFRMSSVAAVAVVAVVAPEDAIDHGADNGNTIAGAFTIAVAIAGAAVVDRGIVVDRSAAVVTAAAGADDNTTATGVAGRSASSAGVASRSISATGGAGHRVSAAATMSGKGLSAATMTIILMAGSQRIRRHRHATQRDRGCESDQSFFVKHVILLLWFKRNLFVTAATTPDRRQGLQGKRTRSRVRPRRALP